MQDRSKTAGIKNPYISTAKLIAAFFVVFIHVKFPGIFGNLTECAARFGVPFFFAVSGYFSYKTTSQRLVKRLKKTILILIISDLIYLGWGIYVNCFTAQQGIIEYIHSLISIKQAALFLFADIRTGKYTFHLWYLTAQIKIYIALFLYLRFTQNRANYKPLYYAAFSLFVLSLGFGIFALLSGINIDPTITRNALFTGFPMFAAGLFLHNYEKELISGFNLNKKKLRLTIFFGFMLSFLEFLGIGKTEMPLGMILVVAALILLLTHFSTTATSERKHQGIFSDDIDMISMIVYIIHPLFFFISHSFPAFQPILQNGWLFPPFVLLCSTITGVLYCLIRRAVKR